jgi:hypothetical protein
MFFVNQLVGFGAASDGAATDPNFSSVKILNHFDANLVDSSSAGFTWTAAGDAASSASQSKFGGGSLSLDGSGDYLTGTYSTANHSWFTADYTIEAWIRMTTFTGVSKLSGGKDISSLIGNMDPSGVTAYWAFGPTTGAKLAFYYWNGAEQVVLSSGTMSTDTWHHVAMTLSGTTIRLFIDGVLDGSASVAGTPQNSAGMPMCMGRFDTAANMTGFVDDFRLTKGVARYTAGFTPPTQAFPNA